MSLKLISLFTCGMGMDIGFEQAGFKTVYANDITKFACDTITKNKNLIHCDLGDITDISSKEILERSGLKENETDIIIGGPPCQSFSTAGVRKGFDDKRGIALLEFIRIIRQIRPKFFVFENVPGLKSIAKKHIGFYEREAMDKSKLSKDEQYGSLFEEILQQFDSLSGYKFNHDVLNAADFGVAQKRKRFILIGSRIKKIPPELIFEEIKKKSNWADPKKLKNSSTKKRPWKTLEEELLGLDDPEKECMKFPSWGKYLKYIPRGTGGNWTDLPDNIKNEAMGGAADSDDPKRKGKQGGRTGFYRRLAWNSPAPTLVTSPTQMGTCICHPDEDRPLSVKEYARLQGFPDNWQFIGTTSQKYRMIGEAVPIQLAYVIAKSIKDLV